MDAVLSELEQPAKPPAAATPAAPAATPRKPRLVRKPWFCSVTGSLSAWPVPAVLHYRAHPLTIRAPPRKLGRLPEEVGPMPDVARTLDLPPGQRFEYWKHALSDTFVPLEVG